MANEGFCRGRRYSKRCGWEYGVCRISGTKIVLYLPFDDGAGRGGQILDVFPSGIVLFFAACGAAFEHFRVGQFIIGQLCEIDQLRSGCLSEYTAAKGENHSQKKIKFFHFGWFN
jgi:hypothetical protein